MLTAGAAPRRPAADPQAVDPKDTRPRVFVSYARSDGEVHARELRDRLQAEGVPLWRDREGMEGGRDWWQQITAAIDRVEFLVLVVTPAALRSTLVRREWRYARQRGVAVYPVMVDQAIDFEGLPRWMRSVHFYDLAHEWRKFTNDLHTRPPSVRVPFMVEDLPEGFVPRPREYAQLLSQLLDLGREEPTAITAGLKGAGGFGKTVLARALCHDEAIQNAYDDGVLWVTLGEQPGDLTGRVEDLIFMLSGARPGFASLEAAVAAFVELIADRDLLLVIDDAWDAAHVRPFLQGGRRCARIITTRNADALPAVARRVDVDAMALDEAVALLGHGLPAVDGLLPLARRLGEWPLLLKMVNGALSERVLHQGQPLDDALAYVNKALDKRGLTFFDTRDATARHAAVALTLGLSLAQLTPDESLRLQEMAVFPEDAQIPLTTLGALWARTGGFDELDTEALCERLARLSLLLSLDLARRFVRLHDVVRLFLLERLGDRVPALHATLVAAGRPATGGWADLPRDDAYWWQHLCFHLCAAGLQDELRLTMLDFRYISQKTVVRTSFSVESDLRSAEAALPDEPQVTELRRVYGQTAHLFRHCRSAAEVRATLFARLAPESALCRAADAIAEPRIVALAPLPDQPHPALVRTLGNRRNAVRACAISADGRLVAAATGDRQATIWDAASGTELRHLVADEEGLVSGRDVRALAFSADGRLVAAATGDRRLWVWNADTGETVARMQGHSDEVTDCALSGDGRWLLSASLDASLKLWDVRAGRLRHTLARTWASDEDGWLVPTNDQGHWSGVLGCAISVDGLLGASASSDQTVILWDLTAGTALRVLHGHEAGVNACAFSTDGLRLASGGSDRTLRIWNVQTGEHRAVAAHRDAVTACAFAPDGSRVVTASGDGTLRVWSAEADELLRTLVGHADWVYDCAVSSTGLIVSAANDGTTRIWQINGRSEPYLRRAHDGRVPCCVATPDGRHVFTGGQDRQVILWDTSAQRAKRWLDTKGGAVLACALRADGRLLATGSEDRSIALWDTVSERLVTTLPGHRDIVNDCAFDPAGRVLASVSADGILRLWDVETRSRRIAWAAHGTSANACAFSPDGRWLVSAGADGSLVRWSMEFGEPLWEAWLTDRRPLSAERAAASFGALTMQGHAAAVNDCAFLPDGKHLVTVAADGTMKMWNAASGALVRSFEGHREGIEGLDIDADGVRIVTVSSDGGLRVWRIADASCQLFLQVDGPLSSCAWIGRGDRLAVTGARGVYLLACSGGTGAPRVAVEDPRR